MKIPSTLDCEKMKKWLKCPILAVIKEICLL